MILHIIRKPNPVFAYYRRIPSSRTLDFSKFPIIRIKPYFSSPVKHCEFYPDFSNLPNIRTNLLFQTWFEKLGFHCIITTVYFIRYSRASRKRPSKMQRLSGRLQESNHRAPLPRRGLGTSTLWKIIYCTQFPSYAMCRLLVHVVTKVLRIFYVAQCTQCT